MPSKRSIFIGIVLTLLSGIMSTWSYGMDARPPITPESKQGLYEFLLWLTSPDAEAYNLVFTKFPPKNPIDIHGDLGKFSNKIKEINNDSKLFLIHSQTAEEKAASVEVAGRLTSDQWRRLILKASQVPTAAGDSIGLIHAFGGLINHLVGSFLQDQQFVEAFSEIAAATTGIKWDGDRARFVYEDPSLEYQVVILGTTLRQDSSRFEQIFSALEPSIQSRFQLNLNTADPLTHVEPFDLLQGAVVRSYQDNLSRSTSRIVLTKVIHRRLYKLLKLTAENDPRGAALSDVTIFQPVQGRDPNTTQILCAGKGKLTGIEPDMDHFDGLVTYFTVNNQKINEANLNQTPVELLCDGSTSTIRSTPVAATPLPLPAPFDMEKIAARGPVKALVTFSLAEETSPGLIGATIAYMSAHGYQFTGMKSAQDTKQVFSNSLTSTDILIAAAHSIDINRFPLGTQKSRVLHFRKHVWHSSGKFIPVELSALFPEQRNQTGGIAPPLNINDLAELFSARRRKTPQSLFVLTLSCDSAGAAISWTNAYRKSLDLDIASGQLDSIAHATDLIHAIAPNGGFPTGTPSELILDMVPALKTVDMLVSGHSPRGVYKRLQQPFKRDWFIKAVEVVEKWFGVEIDPEPLSLDPVYNLDIPHLLDSSGYIVEAEPKD